MRLKICDINVPWPNGTVILPGALKVDKASLPVTIGFDRSVVIGKATNFEEKDGAIWADIEINPELKEKFSGLGDEHLKKFQPTCSISPYTMDTSGDAPNVTDGIMQEVSMIVPSSVFPKEKS